MIFELAPINPNVNDIYYEETSYINAMTKFFKDSKPLFDKYDNDTENYESNSHCIIGEVLSTDLDDRICEAKINDLMNFITPNNYIIGFKLIAKDIIFNSGKKEYVIDKVLYATLIEKRSLLSHE